MRGIGKGFVYILRSESDPTRHYVGVTGDVDERLAWHNGGPCGHTLHHRPWRVIVSMEVPDEQSAVRFEKYLKSGSGRAFTKRHFGPSIRSGAGNREREGRAHQATGWLRSPQISASYSVVELIGPPLRAGASRFLRLRD